MVLSLVVGINVSLVVVRTIVQALICLVHRLFTNCQHLPAVFAGGFGLSDMRVVNRLFHHFFVDIFGVHQPECPHVVHVERDHVTDLVAVFVLAHV